MDLQEIISERPKYYLNNEKYVQFIKYCYLRKLGKKFNVNRDLI